jgi:hypothetical protein
MRAGVRLLGLPLAVMFGGVVVADRAAGSGAQDGVVVREMPRNAANRRALQASPRVSGASRSDKR